MPKNKETFLNLTPIEKIDRSNRFVSKDDYVFDVTELKDYFTSLGKKWLNPHTKKPFDEEDKNYLIAHHPELAKLANQQLRGTEQLTDISSETLQKIAQTAELVSDIYYFTHFNDPRYIHMLVEMAHELGFIREEDIKEIISLDDLCKNYLHENYELMESLQIAHKTHVLFKLYDYLKTKPSEITIIDNLSSLNESLRYRDVKNLSDLFFKLETGDKMCLNGAAGILRVILENIQPQRSSTPSDNKAEAYNVLKR